MRTGAVVQALRIPSREPASDNEEFFGTDYSLIAGARDKINGVYYVDLDTISASCFEDVSENVVKQLLSPILDKQGLPRCGFHAFRHTHATLLLYNGATPQEVQVQLRHAEPHITIRVYGDVQAESGRSLRRSPRFWT